MKKEYTMQKTSIRFFEDIPVRAVWDEESAKWWFCAMDIAEALTKSKNPRKYWNTIKTRKNELSSICRQLKLKAKDGKFYNTDVVDESGLNTVIALIPSKKSDVFARWMKNLELLNFASRITEWVWSLNLSKPFLTRSPV